MAAAEPEALPRTLPGSPEQEGLVAIEIGRDTLAELEFVLKDPPPAGIIDELGESTTNLIFNGWIDQTKTDFVKARSVAIATVKNAARCHQ